MADGTLLGRAQLKNKSINVEANILDEWQEERRLIRDRIRVRTLALLAIGGAFLSLVPLAWKFSESAVLSQRRAELDRDGMQRKLDALEADGKQAQPVIAYDQMVERQHQNAGAMLGNLIEIFNAAPNKVAISKVKASVSGGEIAIELSADSEDTESAQAFASEAGKGRNVLFSVLASTKKSSLLGPDGLGFDIDKKVRVSP